MKVISSLCAILMALTISNCAHKTPEDVLQSQGHYAATLNMREHVFASQPLWASSISKLTTASSSNAACFSAAALLDSLFEKPAGLFTSYATCVDDRSSSVPTQFFRNL